LFCGILFQFIVFILDRGVGVSCCGNERIGWSSWLGVFGRESSRFTFSESIGGGGHAGGTGTLFEFKVDGAGGGGGTGANLSNCINFTMINLTFIWEAIYYIFSYLTTLAEEEVE
jgi:hypothetical protein